MLFTTKDPLELIEGFEKEPVKSLEQAFQPHRSGIPDFSKKIKEAKTKCNNNGSVQFTTDESAAIYLYSMDADANGVYYHLRNAWISDDRTKMEVWFKYLNLLFSAVRKCPKVKATVWQGSQYSEDGETRPSDDSFSIYTCMASGSPSLEAVKQHLNDRHVFRKIFIGYQDVDARDISDYTADDAKQWFILPGFKVKRIKNRAILLMDQ